MGIGAAIAGIGAAASIGGGLISSSAASGAADKAAAASDRAAELSAQTQKEIYGQNKAALTPYMQTGNAAMGQINALLGIPTNDTAGGTDWNAFVNSDPWRVSDYQTNYADQMSKAEYGMFNYNYDMNRGRALDPNYGGFDLKPFTVTASGPNSTTAAAQGAFDNYRNSTGYQFRLGQGMDAINSGYAGRGTLQSGAAMKAISDYGQNTASAEFSNYLGQLGNQQALGLSGASALAGVGQSYANSLGNIYQQNGNNQANAALAQGQGGMQFGNALTGIGGQVIGAAMNPWGMSSGNNGFNYNSAISSVNSIPVMKPFSGGTY